MKKYLHFKKEKDGYVYLKSHIFSYIDDYVFNLILFLLSIIMNRQLLNAKKSWICIEGMHYQVVISHLKSRLRFKLLTLNAYPPNLQKSQNLKSSF